MDIFHAFQTPKHAPGEPLSKPLAPDTFPELAASSPDSPVEILKFFKISG
jgi:hypothetical protein